MIVVHPERFDIFDDSLIGAAVDCSTYSKSSPGDGGRYGTEKHVIFRDGSLPIGLLDRFLRHAPDVEVIDTRGVYAPLAPADIPDTMGEITLRDYQREALETLLQHRVGVCRASTGSGKSIVANAIPLLHDGNWLIMIHRQNLLESLSSMFLRMGGDHRDLGVIQAGKFKPARVTFAMYTSLLKAVHGDEYLKTVDGIVVDECQTAGAAGYQHLLARATHATQRYGLSATPFDRSDGTGLLVEAQLGPQRIHISTERLLAEEQIASFNIYSIIYEHQHSEPIRTAFGYSSAYKSAITGNAERDLVAIECVRRAEMPGFVFVKHKEHALVMAEKIRKFTGLKVECIYGKASSSQRDRALKDLDRGAIDVIVATKVFYEGADVPWTASVIDLAGGRSIIELLQKVGRGSRRPNGKTSCDIWTIQDEGWSAFAGQSKSRTASLRDEGHSVNVCQFVDGELEILKTLPPKKKRKSVGQG